MCEDSPLQDEEPTSRGFFNISSNMGVLRVVATYLALAVIAFGIPMLVVGILKKNKELTVMGVLFLMAVCVFSSVMAAIFCAYRMGFHINAYESDSAQGEQEGLLSSSSQIGAEDEPTYVSFRDEDEDISKCTCPKRTELKDASTQSHICYVEATIELIPETAV